MDKMSPVILRRFDLVIGPTSFNDLSLKASVLLVIGAFLLLVSLSRQPFKNWVGRRNIPVIGEAGTKDFRSTIATGCQKVVFFVMTYLTFTTILTFPVPRQTLSDPFSATYRDHSSVRCGVHQKPSRLHGIHEWKPV